MECECPQCKSKAYKRNGYTRHGKQNHRCLDCGRQFSLEPHYTPTSASNYFMKAPSTQSQVEAGINT